MLHASGHYILPENVPANEFAELGGTKKFQHLKNWAVWLHEVFGGIPATTGRIAICIDG